jgi:hypothetical protein
VSRNHRPAHASRELLLGSRFRQARQGIWVAVGKRLAQWALDPVRAEYDQQWLDYQYEIGLRHHRAKENVTDHAHTATRIGGRDVIGFDAATVGPMHPYLEKGGHSADTVLRMREA